LSDSRRATYRDWADARSESKTYTEILDWVAVVLTEAGRGPVNATSQRAIIHAAAQVQELVRALAGQVAKGIHENPPSLVLFGNPPPMRGPRRRLEPGSLRSVPGFELVGCISHDVHEIRYTHDDDKKSYKHPFDSGDVEMWAVVRAGNHRDILVTGGHGQPLWKDF